MNDRLQRMQGCILGGAVGDALGGAVEFDSLASIRTTFGPAGITDFAPKYGRLGAITDDTQMTLFSLEGLIRASVRRRSGGTGDDIAVVRTAYLRWLYTQGEHDVPADVLDGWLIERPELHDRRAPGLTCLSALSASRVTGSNRASNDSKGCGGVMRAAPAALDPRLDAFATGCDLAAITHGHPSGSLSAGALALIVRRLLEHTPLLDAVVEVRSVLDSATDGHETAHALGSAVELVRRGRLRPEDIESLGGGWVGEEALAIGVAASLAADDFATGVRLAVNHGGDSDSTGSIAGNILGAMHGRSGIPASWLDQLEARSIIDLLVADAYLEFGPNAPAVSPHSPPPSWARLYPGR